MPIKFKEGANVAPPPPPPQETPNFLDKLKSMVPAGIRVGSGVLASEGGFLGAGIAGVGEGLAELVEDPTTLPSWKRIGVEAGLGAIPFGKVISGGKAIRSGLKSGLLSGAGEAGREVAKGEDLSPTSIGLNTVIGGLTGGVLGKFFGGSTKASRLTNKAEYETFKAGENAPKYSSIPSGIPKQTPKQTTAEIMRDQKNLAAVEKWSTKNAADKAAKKAEEEANRLATSKIDEIRGDLEPRNASVSESYSAPNAEGGTSRATVKYGKPKGEAEFVPNGPKEPPTSPTITPEPQVNTQPESPLGKVLKIKKPRTSKKTPEGFKSKAEDIANQYGEPSQSITPPTDDSPTDLLSFFKTKVGATGKNYRQAKEAGVDTTEALAAHKREQSAFKVGKPQPQTPTPPGPPNDDWIQKELDVIKRLKGEAGELDPRALKALTGLAGAGIGAPLGAAHSDDEHKGEGAVIGGLMGAGTGLGIPAAIRGLQNPNLISEGLSNIGNLAPKIQRANLLTSSHGLPANAIIGPYASAVMGSIEKALSKDSRGIEALKNLGPIKFLKEFPKHFEEARGMIGRAEGTALDAATTKSEKLLAVPGTLMTTGDATSRNILSKAGFTPEEAAEITMTNQPWLKTTKGIVNFAKSSPLTQFMLPFSRTTANIAEQGAMRTPGLGFLTHHFMEKAGRSTDSMRTKLVQQGMGLGTMLGGGVIGANLDPETAKIARRYVSNASGQYSLPASIGFNMGQAFHEGKPILKDGFRELADALPLPTARPIQDIFDFTTDTADALSGEKDMSDIRVPRSAYPAVLRELNSATFPDFGSSTPDQPPTVLKFRR